MLPKCLPSVSGIAEVPSVAGIAEVQSVARQLADRDALYLKIAQMYGEAHEKREEEIRTERSKREHEVAEKQEEQQAGLAVALSRAAEGKARKVSNFPSRGRGTSQAQNRCKCPRPFAWYASSFVPATHPPDTTDAATLPVAACDSLLGWDSRRSQPRQPELRR